MKVLLAIALTLFTAISANADDKAVEDADYKAVEDALVRAGVGSRETIHAQLVWSRCTESAVDRFSAQQEPARTVAEAAMAACATEEALLMVASGIQFRASIEETAMPTLIARVMANRAAKPAPLAPAQGR